MAQELACELIRIDPTKENLLKLADFTKVLH